MIQRADNAVSKKELAEQVWHFQGPDPEADIPEDFIKRLSKKTTFVRIYCPDRDGMGLWLSDERTKAQKGSNQYDWKEYPDTFIFCSFSRDFYDDFRSRNHLFPFFPLVCTVHCQERNRASDQDGSVGVGSFEH